MARSLGLFLGILLLAGGLLIGLYGLFALVYNGDCTHDCGDSVDVTLLGHELNANHVGWTALAVALVAIVAGAAGLLRRDSGPRGSRSNAS